MGAIALLGTLLFGCQSNRKPLKTELIVSAAISLKESLEAIQPLYLQAHPQVEIAYNFAGSGTLRHQIEQGAPVDVFISAATNHMDILQENQQLIEATRQDLLLNQMVLIQPRNRAKLSGFQDLTQDAIAKIALAKPDSVPAGQYAKEILTNLRLFATLKTKLIYGKNVRQVLNYVATENVDAGIVYRTDARISDRVKVAAIASPTLHSLILYPIAVVRDSLNPTVAEEFIRFLSTSPAQAIFEANGFAIAQ